MEGHGYWPARPGGSGYDWCSALSGALRALWIHRVGLVVAAIQNPAEKRLGFSVGKLEERQGDMPRPK
jgi:hypothetical protein